MTRPYRRDKGVRSASVIAGLRLEKDTAQLLVHRAREHAESLGLTEVNIAAYSRHLIRMGLGMGATDSIQRERAFTQIAAERRATAERYG